MKEPYPLRTEETCLSALLLDRLLAAETEGLADARIHLDACAECRARLAGLHRARDESLSTVDIQRRAILLMAIADAERRPKNVGRLQRWIPWGALSAVAACAVVLLALPQRDTREGNRTKGSFVFQVLVQTPNGARPLSSDDRVGAGDKILFRAAVDRAGFTLLAGLSTNGTPYLIESGKAAPWKVAPGPPAELPVSARLDESAGDERVFAFFCEEPPAPGDALDAIARQYDAVTAERLPSLDARPVLLGCEVRSVLVRRREVQR